MGVLLPAQLLDEGQEPGQELRVQPARKGRKRVPHVRRRSLLGLRRRRGRLLSLRLPRLPAPQGLGQVHNLRHSIGVREDTIQFFIELSQDKHPR